MTIEKNGAFSSGLVTRRLHLKKKAHKTAKITAMQKLIYKCRRQIVPLAMFYSPSILKSKLLKGPENVVFSCEHSFSRKVALSTCDTGGAELLENSLYVRNQYGNVTVEILRNRCDFSVIFVSYQPHYNQKTII